MYDFSYGAWKKNLYVLDLVEQNENVNLELSVFERVYLSKSCMNSDKLNKI